jgi:hypothetical protein
MFTFAKRMIAVVAISRRQPYAFEYRPANTAGDPNPAVNLLPIRMFRIEFAEIGYRPMTHVPASLSEVRGERTRTVQITNGLREIMADRPVRR